MTFNFMASLYFLTAVIGIVGASPLKCLSPKHLKVIIHRQRAVVNPQKKGKQNEH
jgi:hypothetical protein